MSKSPLKKSMTLSTCQSSSTQQVVHKLVDEYHPHQTFFAAHQIVNRFEHGWQNVQHRSSTHFAEMLENKLYVLVAHLTEVSFAKHFFNTYNSDLSKMLGEKS